MTNDSWVEPDRSSRVSSAICRILFVIAVVYFALLIFNCTTRTGRFSPDSMSYVNVAQNIVAGKGITQPTLGFNQPDFSIDEKPPVPFTNQAPLYPVLAAFVSHFGLSPARAALLVAEVAIVAIFVLIYFLGAELYDSTTGIAAAALLVPYYPMRWMAGWAWADPVGIALALAAIYMLTIALRRESRSLFIFAGIVAGLAFASRYALLPLIAVGAIFLWFQQHSLRKKFAAVVLFAVGFLIPAGAILIRNDLVSGSLLPPPNPVQIPIPENIKVICSTVFGEYLFAIPWLWQIVAMSLCTVAILVVLAIRLRLRDGLIDIFVSQRRWILLLFGAGYLAFLVIQRSRSFFDIDARMIAPAGVTFVLLGIAAVIRVFRIPRIIVVVVAFGLLSFATGQEVRSTITRRKMDFDQPVQQSPRLSWIAANTSEADLIIGDDVIDVPFFLHQSAATLSFSPFPYTRHATHDKIMAYARRHCRDFRTIFLVLHRNRATEEQWRDSFGDFFADLLAGEADKYPGVTLLQVLDDGVVFQIKCR